MFILHEAFVDWNLVGLKIKLVVTGSSVCRLNSQLLYILHLWCEPCCLSSLAFNSISHFWPPIPFPQPPHILPFRLWGGFHSPAHQAFLSSVRVEALPVTPPFLPCPNPPLPSPPRRTPNSHSTLNLRITLFIKNYWSLFAKISFPVDVYLCQHVFTKPLVVLICSQGQSLTCSGLSSLLFPTLPVAWFVFSNWMRHSSVDPQAPLHDNSGDEALEGSQRSEPSNPSFHCWGNWDLRGEICWFAGREEGWIDA